MSKDIKTFDTGTSILSYQLFGNGKLPTVVIETALGSCSAEWRHIAKKLAENYCVLIYDRAGYGTSTLSSLERTPKNVSLDLNKLLHGLGITENIIFVAHSQGALYCTQYAIRHAGEVKAVIFLDPATPYDDEFKNKLSPEEYKNSGIDKTITYKVCKILTSIGLGFTLKSLLKKSPPFYYYQFEKQAENYMLTALTKKKTYTTALNEYTCSHVNDNTSEIENAINSQALSNIPVTVITHSSDIFIKELEYYGNMDNKTAVKIETTWQELMQRYAKLSSSSSVLSAAKSSHYIHLTDLDLLLDTINSAVIAAN